jgi:hypothetical protein
LEKKMKKNFYALKLAGLLKEQTGQPMGAPQDQGGGDQGGEEGGDQGGGEDPAALLDQAIELLNKVKESLGGAAGGEEGGAPDMSGGAAPGGAAPGGAPGGGF